MRSETRTHCQVSPTLIWAPMRQELFPRFSMVPMDGNPPDKKIIVGYISFFGVTCVTRQKNRLKREENQRVQPLHKGVKNGVTRCNKKCNTVGSGVALLILAVLAAVYDGVVELLGRFPLLL